MKTFAVSSLRLVGVAVLLLVSIAYGERAKTGQPSVNDTARFLAGLQPLDKGAFPELTKSAEWNRYGAFMDANWSRFDKSRLALVWRWSEKELRGINQNATVFYPFSGPDFGYVYNFFPHASTYILCGLEPVGDVPDLGKMDAPLQALAGLKTSFNTLFNAGYFVTKEMRVDLKSGALNGAVPILFIMLARSGNTIREVSLIPQGVKIGFVPEGEHRQRTLYYFSADLSNGGLSKNHAVLDFLKENKARNAYVKAASYLMHSNEFSTIRNTLLNLDGAILQDDSGIPVRYFDSKKWQLRLYGTYVAPLDIFRQYSQNDLAELYHRRATGNPLDFGAGYHWNPKEANLLLAVPK